MVWTGRARARVSSILWLSIPTSTRAAIDQQPRGRLGQEGMVVEIGVRPPVPVPAGVRPAPPCRATSSPSKRVGVDRQALFERLANDQPGKAGELLQREPGKVRAVGVAVERRVEIGAGVGDHVDPADLEASSRRRNWPPTASRVQ